MLEYHSTWVNNKIHITHAFYLSEYILFPIKRKGSLFFL